MTNNEWEKDCSVYHCSDGDHPSWWVSISQTKQWQDWYKHASKNMLYDVDESQELGMMSEKHAQDFINFIEAQTRQDTVREVRNHIAKLKAEEANLPFTMRRETKHAWNTLTELDDQLRKEYNIKGE